MWTRVLLLAAIGVELVWIGGVFLSQLLTNPAFGLDYHWHVDASRRLLETGSPYWPWQVAGRYEIGNGAILYPPTAFALFIPFIWLPAVLWWAIPTGLIVYCAWHHRPPLWAWAVWTTLAALPGSLNAWVFGNPSMWIVAFMAAGTVWAWPSVFVLAKPTFAPFALIGIRHRSWWVALAAFAVASLAFGRLWLDWIAVATNSNVDLAYNLPQLPMMIMPLVPWLVAKRGEGFRQAVAALSRRQRVAT